MIERKNQINKEAKKESERKRVGKDKREKREMLVEFILESIC